MAQTNDDDQLTSALEFVDTSLPFPVMWFLQEDWSQLPEVLLERVKHVGRSALPHTDQKEVGETPDPGARALSYPENRFCTKYI